MKKTISAILAVMMLAGVITGCKDTPDDNGKETETSYESTQETEKEEKKTVAKYTKEVYTDSDGKQTVTEYEHDSKGNVIKEVKTYSDGTKKVTEYEYDDKGNIIKEINDPWEIEYEYEYDEKGNKVSLVIDGEEKIEYDSKGNIIRVTAMTPKNGNYRAEYEYEYNDDGTTVKKQHASYRQGYFYGYEYDDNGKAVKRTASTYEGDIVTEYEYDGKGNVIKETETDLNGNQYVTEHEYDVKGNKVVRTVWTLSGGDPDMTCEQRYEYDEEGRIIKVRNGQRIEQEYDYNGSKIKEKRYDVDGVIQEIVEWECDEQGRMVKGRFSYIDGEECGDAYYENEYDENGNLVREVYPSLETAYEAEIENTYTYNEHGDVIYQGCHFIGDVNDKYEIEETVEFDDNGNKIKTIATYSNGEQAITEWKYEYDDNGNIAKAIELENGEVKGTYEYSGYVYFDIA